MNKEGKLISISFIMGILYVYLLMGKSRGISFTIFSILLLGFLFYSLKLFEKETKNKIWLFAIPMVLLSFRFTLSSNRLFLFFDHKVILVLFVTMSVILARETIYDWGIPSFLLDLLLAILMAFGYFLAPYKFPLKSLKGKTSFTLSEKMKKIILGIAISFPLLLIVMTLLSSADMIFQEMLAIIPKNISFLLRNTKINHMIWKGLGALFVATYLYSFIWNLFFSAYAKKTVKEALTSNSTNSLKLDPTVSITVLTLINIVYILFSFIQFSYLFGEARGILPGGFTYSEYARRGFFELIVVTIINFGIILFTLHFTEKNSSKSSKAMAFLLILMGLSTYVMIYSSFYRMNLYQENYGYTYLRILVYFFLLLETILLLGTLFYILKPIFHLGKTYVIIGLVFYICLSFLNIDSFIAKKNIDRYFETGKIDMDYLKHLSSDAAMQMERLLHGSDEAIVLETRTYLHSLWQEVQEKDSWQEFNLSDYKTRHIIYPNEKQE